MRATFEVVLKHLAIQQPNKYEAGRTTAYCVPDALTVGSEIMGREMREARWMGASDKGAGVGDDLGAAEEGLIDEDSLDAEPVTVDDLVSVADVLF